MYGSVSRWRVKDGRQQELEQLFTEMMSDIPPGSLGVIAYRSDADPQEYWVAGRWDSKEIYRANANRPETDANYRRFRHSWRAIPSGMTARSSSPNPELSGGGGDAAFARARRREL